MTPTINFNPNKYVEIFPQIENILQFGVYVIDVTTGSAQWSPGMFHVLGVEPYSIEQKAENIYAYMDEKDVSRIKQLAENSVKTLTPYRTEFFITDIKGNLKRIYAENFLIFDDDGKLKEYNGIFKDISERYNSRIHLEDKVKQLNVSNIALQEFANVASHDLNEPLRKIQTFIDRIYNKHSESFNEDLKILFDKISKSANGMRLLLNDLLDFSRLSTITVGYEKTNLEEIIKNVLSDLEVNIDESKAIINIDANITVDGYPIQLKQLFTNLITNSIKFSKKDFTPIINIKFETISKQDFPMFPLVSEKNYIKITVSDNGIGFEQEYAEKIFNVFQRLHGKSEYSGSGIGLSIVKKVVENHHGFIYANSKQNEGTVFTIIMPQTQPFN